MKMMRALVWLVLALGWSVARAGTVAPVVVLVDRSVTGVTAGAVREAVARELSAEALPPEDPGAARARGTLIVALEELPGGRRVFLTWRDAEGRETGRMVSVGPGEEELLSTIGLLAGNLARDEAGELLHGLQPHVDEVTITTTVTVAQEGPPPAPAAIPRAPEPPAEVAPPGPARRRLAQASLLPWLSTDGLHGHRLTHHLSLNLVGGFSGGLDGLELAGAFNGERGAVRGAQLAGAANVAGGRLDGAQLAGALNVAAGGGEGAQLAGAANYAAGLRGAQLAGAVNVSTGPTRGVQMAGALNQASALAGLQLAGAANVAGDADGAQIAGAFNFANDLHGLQLGAINVARSADWQLGVINVARKSRFQLGVINVAGDNDLSLGVINVVRSQPVQVDVELGTAPVGRLAVRHGSRFLQTIYAVGLSPTGKDTWWMPGLGLGLHFAGERLFADVDLLVYQLFRGADWLRGVQLMPEARVAAGFKIAPRVAIYGGLGLGCLISNGDAAADTVLGPPILHTSGSTTVTLWPTLVGGVRI
jgi:hypothetical protein